MKRSSSLLACDAWFRKNDDGWERLPRHSVSANHKGFAAKRRPNIIAQPISLSPGGALPNQYRQREFSDGLLQGFFSRYSNTCSGIPNATKVI